MSGLIAGEPGGAVPPHNCSPALGVSPFGTRFQRFEHGQHAPDQVQEVLRAHHARKRKIVLIEMPMGDADTKLDLGIMCVWRCKQLKCVHHANGHSHSSEST